MSGRHMRALPKVDYLACLKRSSAELRRNPSTDDDQDIDEKLYNASVFQP